MSRRMMAAFLYGARDIRISEIPIPRLAPGEVLIRVKVALTCETDLKTLCGGTHVSITSLPSPFGHEFAGIVEEAGEEVDGLEAGEAVVAANSAPCMRCHYCKAGQPNICDRQEFLNGAYAEFVRVPESIVRCNLHPLSTGTDLKQAALIEPLACVIHGIERSMIEMGHTVCVIGLGPIGLMFVSMAAKKGARVIALDESPRKIQKALEMGASSAGSMNDPYDIGTEVRELTSGCRGFDVVIETLGIPQAWQTAIGLAKKGGVVNLLGECGRGTEGRIDAHTFHYQEKAIINSFHHTPYNVAVALGLLEANMIMAEDLITHHLPLEELPRAFEYMAASKALKVAIEFPD